MSRLTACGLPGAIFTGYPLVCLDTATPVDNQAGRDNTTLTEPNLSHANCPKTRRLPPRQPRRSLPGIGCIIPAHFRGAVLARSLLCQIS